MQEPIRCGDVCLVVNGLGQNKSPNVGKTVRVETFQGEHSVHGRTWRCTGEEIVQLEDNGTYKKTGWADFPQSWLQKQGLTLTKTNELETSC